MGRVGSVLEHKWLAPIVMALVIVVLIAFGIWYGTRDECARWQQEYEELASQDNDGGVIGFVNLGPPQAALEKHRPVGCPVPD